MAKKIKTKEEAMERFAGLCMRVEYSRLEIVRKMRQWGVDPTEAEEVADWLCDHRFIDGERFARSFVHDKYRFDRWGRQKIRFALRQHGIAPDIIEASLAEIDEEEYCRILKSLVEAKARTLAAETDAYKKKDRLFRYAVSRGFEPGCVLAAVSKVVVGADDFDDFQTGDWNEDA